LTAKFLLRESAPPRAKAAADALRRSVEASQAIQRLTGEAGVTVSIGCATVTPGEPVQDLVRRADAALYESKKDRGRTECATAARARLSVAA